MLRNLKLVLAYDGTEFHGWQFQPGFRTVQECLEQALRRSVRHRVAVVGCSRTDSGVHASGYVANFYTSSLVKDVAIFRSVGARLPKDMTLIDLREVPLTFHATQSALGKLYRYRIHNARGRPVEHQLQNYTYHAWEPLDLEAMREAATHWIGEHDFTSFASAGNERQSNVRRIIGIDLFRRGQEIRIDVEGDGFLYKQVRNMVGVLFEIGRGKWTPADAKRILDARDRNAGGPTAPARGLCLQWVRYDMPSLPEPSTELLARSARAQPPGAHAKFTVDSQPLSSAPAMDDRDEPEPCP